MIIITYVVIKPRIHLQQLSQMICDLSEWPNVGTNSLYGCDCNNKDNGTQLIKVMTPN